MSEQPPDREQNDTASLPGSSAHRYPPPQGPFGFSGQRSAPEPRSSRPSGAFTAGILVAALVVGGISGVAGAVGINALDSSGSDGARAASTPTPTPTTTTTTTKDTQAEPAVVGKQDTAPAPGSVEEVSSAVLPSVVKINVASAGAQGSGSGIILSPDGEILTNNHVVEVASDGGSVSVSFDDGSTTTARVLGTDPLTDLAVIKARGVSGLSPATLGQSGDLDVGEEVVAIGSPFGLEATVTSGIVSALNRPVSVGPASPGAVDDTTYPAIQTDAAINPGNSGGPLANMAGEVVGVNSSIRTASSATEGGSIGLGFAIPLDKVRPIVEQLRVGETPTHARLGVTVTDAAGDNGLLTGASIRAVNDGSAADEAGLREGDVVTRVEDELITSSSSLVATIRGYRPGDTVTLTVVRGGGNPITFDVTLDSDEGSPTS